MCKSLMFTLMCGETININPDFPPSAGRDSQSPYHPCQSPGSLDRGLCPWTWPSCRQRWSGYNPWTSSSWPVCGEANHCKKTFGTANARGELQLKYYNWNPSGLKTRGGCVPWCAVWPAASHPGWSAYTLWSYIETRIGSEREKSQWNPKPLTGWEPQKRLLEIYCVDNLCRVCYTCRFVTLLETDKYERSGLVWKQFKELWKDQNWSWLDWTAQAGYSCSSSEKCVMLLSQTTVLMRWFSWI